MRIKTYNLEQLFIIIAFVLSLMVSSLFGYMVFRYEEVAMCKGEIEVLEQ